VSAATTTGSGRSSPVTLSPCYLVTLSVFLIGGCDFYARTETPPRPVPAEEVFDFSTLYGMPCAGCHGSDGKLGPAPPLNDATFLAIVPDAELQRVVAEGRRGTLMPAWAQEKGGPLTARQVEILAAGIKKQKQWQGPAKSETDLPPYEAPGDQHAGNREAGAKVFGVACAGCHGEQGRGGMKVEGKEIGGVRDPAFLALLSDQELRRFVITGRQDLGMPGYGPAAGRSASFTPLTSGDVSDVVALLAYWRDNASPK
jgi:cytochrome c oxidase cbb3-type subunit III